MLRKMKKYHGDTPNDVVSYNTLVDRLEELRQEYTKDIDEYYSIMNSTDGSDLVKAEAEYWQAVGRLQVIENLLEEIGTDK